MQLYICIWETTLFLQANPYRVKTKNINILIFISTIINKLMLIIFCLKKKKRGEKEKKRSYCILMSFSTELLFKIKL